MVNAADEGAQLAEGITTEMAAQRLKGRIAPVYVVDTGRICLNCWNGYVQQVLPQALRELRVGLVVTASRAAGAPAAGGASATFSSAAAAAIGIKRRERERVYYLRTSYSIYG